MQSDVQPPVWVGITWMVVTGLLFVGVTGIVRHVGSDIPAAQSAFIRYLFGVVLMLPFMAQTFRVRRAPRQWGIFAARGVAHSLGVILWFFAMARIPIAEVTAIGYTAPIYITLGAALFLGERLAARRLIAVAVALIGAMIIIRPGFREIGPGHLAQVMSAPLFAASYLITKAVTRDERPTDIVVMLTVFVTVGLAPFAWTVWVTPKLDEVLWLALVAALATAGHYTMTRGLAAAPLTVTQPVTFLQLVWATMLGAVVFGEVADIWVLFGGGVIIGAVTFISYREAVVARRGVTVPAQADPH